MHIEPEEDSSQEETAVVVVKCAAHYSNTSVVGSTLFKKSQLMDVNISHDLGVQ